MKKRNVLVCTIMTVAMLLQSFVCVTAFAADEPAPLALWDMSEIGKDGYSGTEAVGSWGTNQPHSFSDGKLVYASELGGNHKIAFTTGKSITEDVYTVKVPVRLSGALETVKFYTQVGGYEVNHCIMYDAGTLYNLKGWVASGVFAVDKDYEFGLVFENPADTNEKSQITLYLNGINMGKFTSNANFRTFGNLRLLVTPKSGSTLYVNNVELYKGNYYQSLSITAPTDHPSYVNRPYSGSTSVTFTSGDADENAVWSLDKDYEGVSMDSKTGVLTVTDSAKLGRIKVILSSPLASKTAEYSYRIAEADMNPIAAWYMSEIGKDGYSGTETVSSWGTNQTHSFSGGKLVYASELGGTQKIAFTTSKTVNENIYTIKVPVKISGALEKVQFCSYYSGYDLENCSIRDNGRLYRRNTGDGTDGWIANDVFEAEKDYDIGIVLDNTNETSKISVYVNGKYYATYSEAEGVNFSKFNNFRLLVTPKSGSTLYVGDFEIYGGNVCEPLTMNVNKLAESEVMNAIDAYKAKNLITLPEAYDSIGAEKKSSIAQGLKSKTWATDDEIVTYITCAISENELVPVSDVTEKGILKSAVFAINKDDITLTAASAIFASYDADGTLIGVSVKELTNTSFARYGKISVSDIGLDVTGAAIVKYMLWAGIDTQTPLAVSTVK